MAKTKITEIRLERITKHLEFEMWCVLQEIANNQRKFEKGERTSRETLAKHRKSMELFLRHNRNYCRAVQAANRIDRCESDTERHYRTTDWSNAIAKFDTLCEFFEK